MKKELYCCFLFCCIIFLCKAQRGEDYILTLQQDTLFGKIEMEQGQDPITFSHNKKKINYHPSTIQYFGIFENKQYQRFKSLTSLGGKSIFVKILVEGKIKVYKYTEEHVYPNSTLNRYVYLMGYSDDALVTVSSSAYQRMVGYFLKEHPNLLLELANYSFDEVPQIIEQYNERTK